MQSNNTNIHSTNTNKISNNNHNVNVNSSMNNNNSLNNNNMSLRTSIYNFSSQLFTNPRYLLLTLSSLFSIAGFGYYYWYRKQKNNKIQLNLLHRNNINPN